MFKPISLLSVLLLFYSFGVHAQTDTSYYDLGRVLFKKDFTQAVTVKAEDLEHYQFSDLSDAINVWFYGTYTNSDNVIYAVDGNIVTDVNAYSIFDVDEVTLVQNAANYVNGAPPGTQLILVKLKTNRPGKQGLEAAGQTSLVNLANQGNVPNVHSTHDLYDQFYLSGYKNLENISFGLSANLQHDVLPVLTNSSLTELSPYNTNRFKLNGFFAAKLWAGTALDFNVNYVPQKDGFDYGYSGAVYENFVETIGVMQHMGSSALTINSTIAGGLRNKLSADYNHYNLFGDDYASYTLTDYSPPEYGRETSHADINASNLVLRDNLWYQTKLGIFDLEPGLNFSYARLKDVNSTSSFAVTTNDSGIPFDVSSSTSGITGGYKTYLLTPDVDIYYKKLLNLQAGFVYILNSANDFYNQYHYDRAAPFVTASADILGLAGIGNMSLRLFGSFSRQSQLFNSEAVPLEGITPFVTVLTSNETSFLQANTGQVGFSGQQLNPYQQYNTWQLGFDWHLPANLALVFNYWSFQSVDASLFGEPIGPNNETTVVYYYYTHVSTLRLALNYTLSSNQFTWRTGLNCADSKVQPQYPSVVSSTLLPYISDGHRFSGGFTNRLNYKTFFAGLDLLYQLGNRGVSLADDNPFEPTVPKNVNSFSLQSLYFGSELKVDHLKHAELFVNNRNMWQNSSSVITDNRRFYGLGLKVDL